MIKKIEKSLKRAPEGSLKISSSNGRVQYYCVVDKEKKYISTDRQELARKLAQKDYDLQCLKIALKEKKQVDTILKNLTQIDVKNVYPSLIEQRKELIIPYVMSDEQYVESWLGIDYKGKDIGIDVAEIITEGGERVRSKSEKIIADKLYLMGIPYRYEYPLKLKRFGMIYPDFTILNIRTREEIYMEHFGMMDNPEYCQKAINKIEEYARNGIFVGKKLIVTFETSTQPLNMIVVEQMLKEILGMV